MSNVWYAISEDGTRTAFGQGRAGRDWTKRDGNKWRGEVYIWEGSPEYPTNEADFEDWLSDRDVTCDDWSASDYNDEFIETSSEFLGWFKRTAPPVVEIKE